MKNITKVDDANLADIQWFIKGRMSAVEEVSPDDLCEDHVQSLKRFRLAYLEYQKELGKEESERIRSEIGAPSLEDARKFVNKVKISSEHNVLTDAVETFGKEAQIDMMIEEMSELTKALLKLRRGFNESEQLGDIHDEIADVEIMLDQMKIIFGDEPVKEKRYFKIQRLKGRLHDHKLKS